MPAPAEKSPGSPANDCTVAVMTILRGAAPTEENCVLPRRYVFGDAHRQLPSRSSWLSSAGDDDTLSYFLGVPVSSEMNALTRRLLGREEDSADEATAAEMSGQELQSSCSPRLARRSSSLDFTESAQPFSVSEFDVVSYAVRSCKEAAEKFSASVYQATHSRSQRLIGSGRTASAAPEVEASLTIPEELLGA